MDNDSNQFRFQSVLQIKMASSPPPQNRRKNLDVKKLSSKREVTLLSGLDKFEVKFYGPKDTLYEG